jgi:hypothetical protein
MYEPGGGGAIPGIIGCEGSQNTGVGMRFLFFEKYRT